MEVVMGAGMEATMTKTMKKEQLPKMIPIRSIL
jgi:hypothetical protein